MSGTIDLQWLETNLVSALHQLLTNSNNKQPPEIPWAGARIWSIFLALNATRGSNGWGPEAISFREIECYARLMREPIRPFEIEIIRALDCAYLDLYRTREDAPQNNTAAEISQRPLTPALFDAMFS